MAWLPCKSAYLSSILRVHLKEAGRGACPSTGETEVGKSPVLPDQPANLAYWASSRPLRDPVLKKKKDGSWIAALKLPSGPYIHVYICAHTYMYPCMYVCIWPNTHVCIWPNTRSNQIKIKFGMQLRLTLIKNCPGGCNRSSLAKPESAPLLHHRGQ